MDTIRLKQLDGETTRNRWPLEVIAACIDMVYILEQLDGETTRNRQLVNRHTDRSEQTDGRTSRLTREHNSCADRRRK